MAAKIVRESTTFLSTVFPGLRPAHGGVAGPGNKTISRPERTSACHPFSPFSDRRSWSRWRSRLAEIGTSALERATGNKQTPRTADHYKPAPQCEIAARLLSFHSSAASRRRCPAGRPASRVAPGASDEQRGGRQWPPIRLLEAHHAEHGDGKVCNRGPAKTTAKIKLFHEKMNARMPETTIPGRVNGTATRRKLPKREQPSIRGAFLQFLLHPSKKPSITQMTSGSPMMRCVRISAR